MVFRDARFGAGAAELTEGNVSSVACGRQRLRRLARPRRKSVGPAVQTIDAVDLRVRNYL